MTCTQSPWFQSGSSLSRPRILVLCTTKSKGIMSTTEYPSSLGYNEKVPVSESGNTSPSSPKSRRFSNSTEAGSARPFIHWVRPAKPTKSPTVSGGSNASYSPEDVKLDEGWPLLAQVMEKNPEFEAFARFRELNVKNLLYYQVELDYLGDMLRMQELRDSNPVARHATDQKFSKFPVEMIQQYEDEQSKDGKYTGEHCWQWDYVLRIRRCLREYNEALLQYAQVSALPEANGREMETLTEWIINPQGGRYSISSYGAQVWGKLYEYVDEKKGIRDLMERLWDGLKDIVLFWGPRSSAPRTRSDLVVPRPGVKADAVAAWITYALVPWLSDLVLALRGKPRENRFSGKREVGLPAQPPWRPSPGLHRLMDLDLD